MHSCRVGHLSASSYSFHHRRRHHLLHSNPTADTMTDADPSRSGTPRYDPALYTGLSFDPFHPVTGYAKNDWAHPFLASRLLTWFEVTTAISTGRVELLMRTPASKANYVAALVVRKPLYRSTADIIRHRFFLGRPYYASDSDRRLCCDSKDIEKPSIMDDLEQLSHHSRLCPASASATSVHDSVCVHFITRKSPPSPPPPTETKAPSSSASSTTSPATSGSGSGSGSGMEVVKTVWTLNEFPYALEDGIYHSLLWYPFLSRLGHHLHIVQLCTNK